MKPIAASGQAGSAGAWPLETVPRAAAPAPAAVAVPQSVPALDLRRLVVPLPRGPLTIEGWRIDAGDKVALIGRNGVGKTSLTEAVLGLRDGAVVEGAMLGVELATWRRRPALRKRLGVQLQRVAFPGRPRVRELVAMHRALYDKTSADVIDALGVQPLSQRLYEFLSRGETQRIDLFLAMAHEPEILFLDEPFTGLDPQFVKNLAGLIRAMTRTTILMCCHTVEELNLVHKIAWLSHAGLAHYGEREVLRHELVGDFRLTAQCDDEATARQIALELAADPVPGRRVAVEAGRLTLCGSEPLANLARTLVDRAGVQAVEAGRSSLSDVLRHCAREA